MDAYGWVLAGFVGITAILITWQIYTVISIKRVIKKRTKKILNAELKRIKGECVGTSFYAIAELAEHAKPSDPSAALGYYIKAANNLKDAQSYQKEIEICLDRIDLILSELDESGKRLGTQRDANETYYRMLLEINDRSRALSSAFLRFM